MMMLKCGQRWNCECRGSQDPFRRSSPANGTAIKQLASSFTNQTRKLSSSEVEEDIMKVENQTNMFTAVQADIMKLENKIPMFSLQMILQWQAGTNLDLNSILREVWHTLSPFLYKRDRMD